MHKNKNKKKERNIKILPCSHKFHGGCIDAWLVENNNCPLCRAKIESPPFKKQKTKYEYDFAEQGLPEIALLFPSGIPPGIPPIISRMVSPLEFLDPCEDQSESDSDDEKSIDYGDESDFEEECLAWEDDAQTCPWSFRVSSTLVVGLF